MPHVIVTGGPGAGKTTLLARLGELGYPIVDESARAIIAERIARGESPRPDPIGFAREIVRRDIEKYDNEPQTARWTFFDRGLVEALGMLHDAAGIEPAGLAAALAARPFHRVVLVLPPWEAIYAPDAERDQTFADAVRVHDRIVRWYRACGYTTHEVPRLTVADRADHVLRALVAARTR